MFDLTLPAMGQKKLVRFEEIKTFPNVFQYPEDKSGKWHTYFGNKNLITLELACGKGEYTIGLSQLYPDRNFVGIDLKGNRLWVGAKKAIKQHLKNVAFLRIHIDKLNLYFEKNEVSEIWITFPDPQLRSSKDKKRLTHPGFLRIYQQVLVPNGIIHLKTDSPQLYKYTKHVIELYGLTLITETEDLHKEKNINDELLIRTHYESLDISGSRKIHYLQFMLPPVLPGKELDNELKQLTREHEGID